MEKKNEQKAELYKAPAIKELAVSLRASVLQTSIPPMDETDENWD